MITFMGAVLIVVGAAVLAVNRALLRRLVRVQGRIVDYEVHPQSDEDVFCHHAVYELRAKGQTLRVLSKVGVTQLEIKDVGTLVTVYYDPRSGKASPVSGQFLMGGPLAAMVLGVCLVLI